MSEIKVGRMVLGPIGTNTYLVMDEETRDLAVIDPAANADRIMQAAEQMGGIPRMILLTHGHHDHIGAVNALRDAWHVPCMCLEQEAEVLADPSRNLSSSFGGRLSLEADRLLQDEEEIAVGGHRVIVLATPGHTAGGCCYYLPDDAMLFSGDTLFACSVGRTDFPTGDMAALIGGIREKLLPLPEETVVLPGHGEMTSIGSEKRENPYL